MELPKHLCMLEVRHELFNTTFSLITAPPLRTEAANKELPALAIIN